MIDINLNIPIDNTPTDGSTNLIDSNAVFDALALKENNLPSIVGNSLKVLRVNAGETAKEWATIPSGITIGTTPITSGVAGRVLFEGVGNVVQENQNLTYDITNNILNIGAFGLIGNEGNLSVRGYASLGGRDRGGYGAVGSNYYLTSTNSFVRRFLDAVSLIEFPAGGFQFKTSGAAAANSNILLTELMRITAAGFIGIGTTSPQARLDARAQGALSTDIALRVRNSADTSNLFMVKGNGVLNAANLPTSATGLVAGDIWNNSGVLNIV